MHDASSSTTPSSLGRPPSPTAWSSGSSSSMLTPAMMASRVSAFWRVIMSYARATPRMPLADETTTGGPAYSVVEPAVCSTTSARAWWLRVSPAAAAAPTPMKWRLEIDTLTSAIRVVDWVEEQQRTTPLVAVSSRTRSCSLQAAGQFYLELEENRSVPLTPRGSVPSAVKHRAPGWKAESDKRLTSSFQSLES